MPCVAPVAAQSVCHCLPVCHIAQRACHWCSSPGCGPIYGYSKHSIAGVLRLAGTAVVVACPTSVTQCMEAFHVCKMAMLLRRGHILCWLWAMLQWGACRLPCTCSITGGRPCTVTIQHSCHDLAVNCDLLLHVMNSQSRKVTGFRHPKHNTSALATCVVPAPQALEPATVFPWDSHTAVAQARLQVCLPDKVCLWLVVDPRMCNQLSGPTLTHRLTSATAAWLGNAKGLALCCQTVPNYAGCTIVCTGPTPGP